MKLWDPKKKKYNIDYNQTLVPAGYLKSTKDGRLQFLTVIGGSHMVPMDVPRAALDMIRRFMAKESLFDAPQPRTEDQLGHLMKASGSEAASFTFSLSGLVFLIASVATATVCAMHYLPRIKSQSSSNLVFGGSSTSFTHSYVEIPRVDRGDVDRSSYQTI